MINHTNCDHPSTSGARAKCRRSQGAGTTKTKSRGATPRVVKDEDEDRYGQTPGRREDECHKCGVERIGYSGTDPVTKILLYVGPKCLWYIKDSDDLREVL